MVRSEPPDPARLELRLSERDAVGQDGLAGQGAGGARLWRVAAAEAAGTALLVLLTCLPGCVRGASSLTERALGSGLVVAALVQCFDHVSGAHFNPTVTLVALLLRRVGGAHAGTALVAQAAGGLVGAVALSALAAPGLARCVTAPAQSLGAGAALAVEMLLGALLALVNAAAWDATPRDAWPLIIGLSVAALTFAAGDVTGASANPVRSAAPALLAGDLRALWVYCVGPPCGAGIAAALYAAAWRLPPRTPPRPPRDRAAAVHCSFKSHAADRHTDAEHAFHTL